jgi:hypothetical protein
MDYFTVSLLVHYLFILYVISVSDKHGESEIGVHVTLSSLFYIYIYILCV